MKFCSPYRCKWKVGQYHDFLSTQLDLIVSDLRLGCDTAAPNSPKQCFHSYLHLVQSNLSVGQLEKGACAILHARYIKIIVMHFKFQFESLRFMYIFYDTSSRLNCVQSSLLQVLKIMVSIGTRLPEGFFWCQIQTVMDLLSNSCAIV